MKIQRNKLILVSAFCLFVITRLYNLISVPAWEDNFSWLYRINYYPWIIETNFKGIPEAGKDLKFAGTLSYHPGVPLMTLSGMSTRIGKKVLKQADPSYTPCNYLDTQCKYLGIELVMAKIPLILLGAIALTIVMSLLIKTFGQYESIIFGLILILEPVFYTTSRDLHLDFLQSILITTSFVFLITANKHRELYSGIIYGITLLTRFASILFIPGFFVLFENLYKNRRNKWGLFAISSIIAFIAFYPPMWVAPISTIRYILNGSIDSTTSHLDYTNDIGKQTNYFLGLQTYAGYMGTSTTLLWQILALVTIFGFIYIYNKQKSHRNLILITFVFYFIYLLLLNISAKKIERYVTPVLMGFSLIISLVLPALIKEIKTRYKK